MKDNEHRAGRRLVVQLLALIVLGSLAYAGIVAARDAVARQLGSWVILFAMGAAIVTLAVWFYPRLIARVVVGLGAAVAAISMIVVFLNGLRWEPVVGFCVMIAAEVVSSNLSMLWWPLRKLSAEDRRVVFRRLRQLSYRERRRVMFSRQYDQFLPRKDTPTGEESRI